MCGLRVVLCEANWSCWSCWSWSYGCGQVATSWVGAVMRSGQVVRSGQALRRAFLKLSNGALASPDPGTWNRMSSSSRAVERSSLLFPSLPVYTTRRGRFLLRQHATAPLPSTLCTVVLRSSVMISSLTSRLEHYRKTKDVVPKCG
jgi:hypothetical protein